MNISPARPIQVLLVDDHRLIRDGISALLNNVSDIRVAGSVSSGEEAINQVPVLKPDVILMDIVMGGMNGIEATRWIKEQSPATRIILITSEVKREFVAAGIRCGIDGYLPKDVPADTLIEAIRHVHNGQKYFNEAITSLVFDDFYNKQKNNPSPVIPSPTPLTKRELEVLALVASGKSNKTVAEELFLSVKTIETHKSNILDKLGLRNTAEIVKYAIQHKLIKLD
jgi:DNA-binding NarL/FixJ family response regulator